MGWASDRAINWTAQNRRLSEAPEKLVKRDGGLFVASGEMTLAILSKEL